MKSYRSMRRRSRTSTIAANHIVDLCKNGIDVDICQIRISEIQSNLDNCKLIVTTSKVQKRLRCSAYHRHALHLRHRRRQDRKSDLRRTEGLSIRTEYQGGQQICGRH